MTGEARADSARSDRHRARPRRLAQAAVAALLATALGAKRVGASRKAIIGAVLGTFAGLFVFPPFGLFLGPFAGAVAGELLHMRGSAQLGHAARVGFGTWVGILVGVALKLTLALAMIGLFLLAWRT